MNKWQIRVAGVSILLAIGCLLNLAYEAAAYFSPPLPSGLAIHTTWGDDGTGEGWPLPEIGIVVDGKAVGVTDQFGYLLVPCLPGEHSIDTYGKWVKELNKRVHVTADVKPGFWNTVEIHLWPE